MCEVDAPEKCIAGDRREVADRQMMYFGKLVDFEDPIDKLLVVGVVDSVGMRWDAATVVGVNTFAAAVTVEVAFGRVEIFVNIFKCSGDLIECQKREVIGCLSIIYGHTLFSACFCRKIDTVEDLIDIGNLSLVELMQEIENITGFTVEIVEIQDRLSNNFGGDTMDL